jgi:hypothetical protein
VRAVYKKVQSQHKRLPVIEVSPWTIDWDFRYPRDWGR